MFLAIGAANENGNHDTGHQSVMQKFKFEFKELNEVQEHLGEALAAQLRADITNEPTIQECFYP